MLWACGHLSVENHNASTDGSFHCNIKISLMKDCLERCEYCAVRLYMYIFVDELLIAGGICMGAESLLQYDQ
jgi:hypothetical protein